MNLIIILVLVSMLFSIFNKIDLFIMSLSSKAIKGYFMCLYLTCCLKSSLLIFWLEKTLFYI